MWKSAVFLVLALTVSAKLDVALHVEEGSKLNVGTDSIHMLDGETFLAIPSSDQLYGPVSRDGRQMISYTYSDTNIFGIIGMKE